MMLRLRSEAFTPGGAIPRRHTPAGEDLSPPLAWDQAPAETRELALIVDDPDAPGTQPWVHWLLYGIPDGMTALPEGVPPVRILSQLSECTQGLNSWGRIGYRGPSPPPGHGPHRYRFTLYALKAPLRLEPGADKAALLEAMEDHILARAEIVGTYAR